MIPEPGERIKFIMTDDPFTRLKAGTLGTVLRIDEKHGIIDMLWDDGSTLGLIIGKDRWTTEV